MKNMQELRSTLAGCIEKVTDGKMSYNDAVAVGNLAGKMIQSSKVQLEHCSMRGEKPNIEFLVELKDDKPTAVTVASPKGTSRK